MDAIYIIVLLIAVVVIALIVAMCIKHRGSLSAVVRGGYEDLVGGAPPKRKPTKNLTVGGPRDGLKVQKEIELTGKTIDKATIDKAIEAIDSIHTGYGPVTEAHTKKMKEAAGKLKVDPMLLERLAHIVIANRTARAVEGVIAASDDIVKMSSDGKTIMEIAEAKSFPPIAVARQILMTRGNDLKKTRAMLNGEEKLPEDLVDQVAEAAKADHGSSIWMKVVRDDATAYEKSIEAMLKKNKIAFKTEEELRTEQTSDPRFGRPVATPDFFFPEPIKINGQLVNWLDVKDWPLFSDEKVGARMMRQLGYQAIKYNKHFGRGAFMFSCGIVPDTKLSTDKGPIDITIL